MNNSVLNGFFQNERGSSTNAHLRPFPDLKSQKVTYMYMYIEEKLHKNKF